MNRMYLIRHGENLANLTKEFSYKKVDYPLTEKGVLQAHQTAEYLSTKPINAVYSSPLRRCIQTATFIAEKHRLNVQVDEDLREVNVGDLEGKPVSQSLWDEHNDVIQAWIEGFSGIKFPGGENQYQLAQRFATALKRIDAASTVGHTVVVGHGGLFTFGLPILCPDLSLIDLMNIPNHNASITTLDLLWKIDHFTMRLQEWANVAHLSGVAADFVHGIPQKGELKN
jgi:broad specificity phosphatase PhoE